MDKTGSENILGLVYCSIFRIQAQKCSVEDYRYPVPNSRHSPDQEFANNFAPKHECYFSPYKNTNTNT